MEEGAGAQFPPLGVESFGRSGCMPSHGYVTLEHPEALISHYPPEPDRPFVVHWTHSERDASEVFDDLTAYLRSSGATRAEWWFRDDSTPVALEELVVAQGAELVEDQVGLARAIDGRLPDIAPGVRVTVVETPADHDAVVDIGVEVFGTPEPPDRAALFAQVQREFDTASAAWVVGWLDGVPVGRARVGFEWQVAPLTGAAVLPSARRSGVYAAMLAARLDLAQAVRCHTAVVKARRTQSLPVLLREGFVPIAHERAHLLDLPARSGRGRCVTPAGSRAQEPVGVTPTQAGGNRAGSSDGTLELPDPDPRRTSNTRNACLMGGYGPGQELVCRVKTPSGVSPPTVVVMSSAAVVDLEFEGEVWEWRGPAPYHFVSVPDDLCDEVREAGEVVSYGWGMVPATLWLGDTMWTTSLWPREGGYVVPLRDRVRAAESVELGDVVTVRMEIALTR